MHAPTRTRRSLALASLASAAMLLALLPATASATDHAFTNYREAPNNACGLGTPVADFADRHAAAEAHQRSIDCVAHHGIAEGRDGHYLPHDPVTRAQMASFIARTLEAAGDRALPDDPDDRFDDTEGSVHEHRIDQLAEIGVVEGRGENTFDPHRHVTRAQMASFLVRAAAWNHTGNVRAYEPAGDDPYFLDVDPGAHDDNIRVGYELWLFEGRAAGEYAPNIADGADDGLADDIAGSDQGHAYIRDVNGAPVMGRSGMVRNVAPQDGRITFTLVTFAEQPDCAVAVAFDDRAPTDQLRLDAGQRPANAFGFVVANWEQG